MFDTMTLTKIAGAFCGTLLILLMGKWGAEIVYHVGDAGHGDGHGDDHGPKYAYMIEVEEEGGAEAEAEPEIPFAELLASADLAAGENKFKACKACHKVEDGQNGTGPHLYGVVGRAVAGVEGFTTYSGNLVKVAETWGPEELDGFLENPKAYAPGTKMTYKGLKDPEDRANLIAWLDSLDD